MHVELQNVMATMFTNYIGPGAEEAHTVNFRKRYPEIIEKYGIKSVNDAGCGLGWVKDAADIDYKGFDILKRENATILDFTDEIMPEADLIVCRDVLLHLPSPLVLKAIENFRKSSKYLLASSHYDADNEKLPEEMGGYNSLISLVDAPFNLGEPLEKIEEPMDNRFMGLWKL